MTQEGRRRGKQGFETRPGDGVDMTEDRHEDSGEIAEGIHAVNVRHVHVLPGSSGEETEIQPLVSHALECDNVTPSTLYSDLAALHAALIQPGRFRDEAKELYERVNQAAEDFYWIAHITATATSRAAKYSVWSGVRTGTRMLHAATSSRSFDEFVDRYEEIAVDEMDRQEAAAAMDGGRGIQAEVASWRGEGSTRQLRDRGEELLERSADVNYDSDVHPAFPKILDQLAPDEARILRLLAMEGPQPSVNVRDSGWLPVSTELVAAGLSMVGTEAGLMNEKRTQAYLNNLNRLGLVWFCDEPVEDIGRYQLVEAQPDVKAAIDSCKREKIVRRSIHLTPFGIEFCRVCLPVEIRYEDASGVYDAPINRTERGGSKGRRRIEDDG